MMNATAPIWTVTATADSGVREYVLPVTMTAQGALGAELRAALRVSGTVEITAYRFTFKVTFPGLEPVRVHHQVLPRLHRAMTVPLDVQLGGESLPRTDYSSPGNYDLPAGHQDMQLHPCLVLLTRNGPTLLVGPLTQASAQPGYSWRMLDERTAELSAEFRPLGQQSWRVAENSVFNTEVMMTAIGSDAFGPETFMPYHMALLSHGRLGRTRVGPVSRDELIWGSWNEGIHRGISEKLILTEAAWIATNLPNVRWIEVDDGYQAGADEHNDGAAFGLADLGIHASDDTAWSRERFPRGMRALADGIRELGLRPMIWFSPMCLTSRPLFRDRPELFIPDARLHFVPELAFPDFSVPATRDLVERALDRLLIEWSFEGVKLDFWTYPLAQASLRLRQGERTNLEWMAWLESQIRSRLPSDGLMLSCLEPGNGDPFRSESWDMYRIGPDAGALPVPVLAEIAIWIASLVGLKQTQRFFSVPDGDGLSLFRRGGKNDAYFRLVSTLLAASGTACELAGRLSGQADDSRMPAFLRVASALRLGQRVTCPGYDWVEMNGTPPSVWVRHDEAGRGDSHGQESANLDGTGGKLIGLTNWGTQAMSVEVSHTGIEVAEAGAWVVNLFDGNRARLPLRVTVGPEDGSLWRVES